MHDGSVLQMDQSVFDEKFDKFMATQCAMTIMQATGLAEHRDSGAPMPTAAAIRMHLPDLSKLTNLTALNLSDNRLSRVPPVLSKLKQLRFLDLSCNQELQVSGAAITYIDFIVSINACLHCRLAYQIEYASFLCHCCFHWAADQG